MTIFTMFFVELMASRFDIMGSHSHDHEDVESVAGAGAPAGIPLNGGHVQGHGHSHSHTHTHTQAHNNNLGPGDHKTAHGAPPHNIHAHAHDSSSSDSSETNKPDTLEPYSDVPVRTTSQFAELPGGADHLGHKHAHSEHENFGVQMTSIFILEFGVIFHSIFIGLTLAVAGEEFVILYIVLVFHQTFEGLGLGSRLAIIEWPQGKEWMPWVLGAAYGFTTPIAIAIGLGVRKTFVPGSTEYLMVNGIFDSISAGILIYTGLVELMAHEFMFNQEMRKGPMGQVLGAFVCMCLGAGLMALLGKWA